MSADDDSELARLLQGVKRLRSDRINVYQQRKPHPDYPKIIAATRLRRPPLTPKFLWVHVKATSTVVCR